MVFLLINLIKLLKESEAKIRVVSIDNVSPFDNQKDIEFIKLDLRNYDNCLKACNNIDIVFHVAGIKGSPAVALNKPASFFVPTITFNTNLLEAAVKSLSESYGDKLSNWVYGQIDYKHIMLWHQLSTVVKPDIAAKLNVGPLPRGGDGFTVNNTGGYNNQYSGASFRILVDTEDWDRTLGMNNPGQSGNPNSRYYNNLFEEWASDGFFPLFYSREKVESVTSEKIKLIPNKHFK